MVFIHFCIFHFGLYGIRVFPLKENQKYEECQKNISGDSWSKQQ